MEALSILEIVKAVDGVLLCGKEDTRIDTVSTNSKEVSEGTLFVPIIGERSDAHDFIASAFENGATAVFTSRYSKEAEQNRNKEKTYIGVSDTKEALQKLAAFYRSKFTLPVIGITGSVGKTTTKEMIAAALMSKKRVLKTIGNRNSQVGVALMMFQISKEHEIAVIEMGISEEGEMEKLAKIAKPNIAVMTNIGVSHIAQLKTRENIRKEKLNIIGEFKENGELYVCGNDSLLNDIYIMKKTQIYDKIEMSPFALEKIVNSSIVPYGLDDSFPYFASDIKTSEERTYFLFHAPGKEPEEVVLNVLGNHNVQNAVVALAIASYFGIGAELAKKGLFEYRPIAMRGQMKEIKGVKWIDDTYNASPDSMKSGIDVLLSLDGVKRRIAVLADVLELGEHSYKCHYEVGEYIADKNIDLVITIGENAQVIGKAVTEKNESIPNKSFFHNEDAMIYLKEYLKDGDGVLIKGSRGMHTEEIIAGLSE